MTKIPDSLYQQIHSSMPIPCVDAVIIHDGQVLLGQRNNKPAQGQWWLPGGRVRKGETLQAAITRKVKEETGLNLETIKQIGTGETIFPDGPFGEPTHTINTYFLAIPHTPITLIPDLQHDNLQWFSDLPENIHPYVSTCINQAKAEYNLSLTN
jgi:colanic acid biosynthesis protein WcaH